MNLESTNFVTAIHSIEVGGETVDVIELADGRVLAIDGEAIILYEDLESLIDSEDEEEHVERPAIAL